MNGDTWMNVATGLACRIQYEFVAGRRALVDESVVRLFTADILDATTALNIDPEYNTKDLPGNKRLDLVGWSANRKFIDLCVEIKWVRPTGGIRAWVSELGEAALRLARITTDVRATTAYAIVMASQRRHGVDEVFGRGFHHGEKGVKPGTAPLLPEVLPSKLNVERVVAVRDCRHGMRKFWRDACGALNTLPVSLRATLVAEYTIGTHDDHIAVHVWEVKRQPGHSTFDPKVTWGT